MFNKRFRFDSYGCPSAATKHNETNQQEVFLQNIKFRKIIVIVQRIVCTFYILHT